jgi:hypothetical protein
MVGPVNPCTNGLAGSISGVILITIVFWTHFVSTFCLYCSFGKWGGGGGIKLYVYLGQASLSSMFTFLRQIDFMQPREAKHIYHEGKGAVLSKAPNTYIYIYSRMYRVLRNIYQLIYVFSPSTIPYP